jgi:hypothetical protein
MAVVSAGVAGALGSMSRKLLLAGVGFPASASSFSAGRQMMRRKKEPREERTCASMRSDRP